MDGVTISKTDTTGVTTTYMRTINASGIHLKTTDGRGNTMVIDKNILGWTEKVTDAAGYAITTEYDLATGNPSCITNALGKTTCFAYDGRGRKIAEWGTGIQPVTFSYDEADRLISLTTYRVASEEIMTNPSGRTDGDSTMWMYHEGSGLVVRKTYEDGTHEDSQYSNLNLLVKKTDARGIVSTYTWDTSKGVCIKIGYSDGSPSQDFVYNHLSNMYKVADASGTRNIVYNIYNEKESESIAVSGAKHSIIENMDAYGRPTGYIHDKGYALQTIAVDYDANGRIATTGFRHGDESTKSFIYSYLGETKLLQKIVHPNGIVITRTYEERRDLITAMNAKRSTTDVVLRGYTYDELGRPVTRTCSRQAKTRNDAFEYNDRSELSSATLGETPYTYAYDNIGNRETSKEVTEELKTYATNPLNQYLSISQNTQTPFLPEYDAAGNQTKIRTSTGIWTAVYDANNRPISFTSEDGQTLVECGYDYMGRRFMKKVTVGDVVQSHHFYLYRGYLQIAALDMKTAGAPALWYTHWDPTESTATRPLSIRKNGTWYSYGHDLTKNVAELYKTDGTLAATYDYAPYGAVTATGTDQPFQWGSEVYDAELGMVYYNYRHYNPSDGRWIGRDMMQESASVNLYHSFGNQGTGQIDVLGLECYFPEQPLTMPKKKSDCKKRTFIFIGGANDDDSGIMKECKEKAVENDKKNTYSYYHWDTDASSLAGTIQAYQKKCPKTKIVLVGHSYGGDTAMDVAEALDGTGQKVTLVTLDPVSEFDSHNLSSGKPDSVDYWINAYVGKGAGDFMATVPVAGQLLGGLTTIISGAGGANTIATLGGKWGHESGADVNIKFPYYGKINHAEATDLYTNGTNNSNQSPRDYLNNYLN